MKNLLDIVLFLLAAIFFALATFGVSSSRINFVAAGLFCCALDWWLHAVGA